jgi:ABC-2 type transport system permease protein
MHGGAVVVAAGNYALSQQQFGAGITLEALPDNLKEMLASYGVTVDDAMVLDPQNEPFPVQVQRNVGGMQVVEIQQVPYPFFVDVRPDGMSQDSPIVSSLPAVTLHWASPLTIDEEKNQGREVQVLLQSSAKSWLRSDVDVQPNLDLYPDTGFPLEGEQAARPLAVSIRGSFESFFKDRGSPFESSATMTQTVEGPLGTISVSPESSRLVVIGSVEFIDDAILQLSQSLSADRYLQNLQFVQNAVDWSAEDQDLLSIRSRGSYARLLKDLNQSQQSFWEGLNYALAVVSLAAIGAVAFVRRRNEQPMALVEREKQAGGSDE